MTSPESTAIEPEENAFATPEANLNITTGDKPVLELERFSAWWVFLLGIVTQNLYGLYWLYSRGQKVNSLSPDIKANMLYLYIAIPLIAIGTVLSFIFDESNIAMTMVYSIGMLIGFILWVFYAFSLRKVLMNLLSKGQEEPVHLGGVLTFFFSVIYFQYKINEAIDAQSDA